MAIQTLTSPQLATRWQVFVVRCAHEALTGTADPCWAQETLARRWPNVPANVVAVACRCRSEEALNRRAAQMSSNGG